MTRGRAVILVAAFCLMLPVLTGAAPAPDAKDVEATQSEKKPNQTEKESTEPEPEGNQEVANSADVPRFLPPRGPYPKARVGGATRGTYLADLAGIEALVPERVGLTLEEYAVLYWFVPKQIRGRAELKLIRENAAKPLLETTIDGPFHPGVQPISLADYAAGLRPDVTYRWLLTVVPKGAPRSEAVTVGGGVRRVEAPAALRARLGAAPDARVPHVLADAGIWYDAVDVLSKRIDAAPGDANLRNQRAALFEQVGLREVALQERSADASGRR